MPKLFKMYPLNNAEIKIVSEHREKEARQKAAIAFQEKAIRIAYKWSVYSKKNLCGLTFSTFANEFGYQDADHQSMYVAVAKIINTAWECAQS